MSANVEVVCYNPNWPTMFQFEATLIRNALGANCLAIHHIGSTSVPGLFAKPIIDILPVVKSIIEVNYDSKNSIDAWQGVFSLNFIFYLL